MIRRALERLDAEERAMTAAILSNGNVGGEDLKNTMADITSFYAEQRDRVVDPALSERDLEEIVSDDEFRMDEWWKDPPIARHSREEDERLAGHV